MNTSKIVLIESTFDKFVFLDQERKGFMREIIKLSFVLVLLLFADFSYAEVSGLGKIYHNDFRGILP